MVNKLTAKEFWGRGYTKDGMKKAADFIAEEYNKLGLIPFGTSYKQAFNLPVNTFPGKMMVEVDGKN
jgi:aminopeptidase YwaD